MTEIAQKKQQKEIKKKSDFQDIIDKEVLALTGGIYPIALQQTKADPIYQKWIKEQIKILDGKHCPGYHWPFLATKYDKEADVVKFTREEHDQYLKSLDQSWSFEETDYLFDLCRQFNCQFIVIQDRYDFKDSRREIYDLKDRFYSVTSKLLQERKQTTHPLSNYRFDPLYDQKRLQELEKYLKRDKNVAEDEKRLLEEIKKIEVLIKKQERESQNLRKTIKMDDIKEDEIDDQAVEHIIKLNIDGKHIKNIVKQSFMYLRSQWVNDSLELPAKVQKKLENWIREFLQLPQGGRIFMSQENEELYDKVRHLLLALFSQQRLERRREMEKKVLEEKVRKLTAQIEQQGQLQNQALQAQLPPPPPDRHPPQGLEFDKYSQGVKKQKVVK